MVNSIPYIARLPSQQCLSQRIVTIHGHHSKGIEIVLFVLKTCLHFRTRIEAEFAAFVAEEGEHGGQGVAQPALR